MSKRNKPKFYITEEVFQPIQGSGNWTPADLFGAQAGEIREFLNNTETIGVFASGSLNQPVTSEGLDAVGGIDWYRIETRPKKNEKELNAYHYVVGAKGSGSESRYPIYGPFKEGTLTEHHTELDDLVKNLPED